MVGKNDSMDTKGNDDTAKPSNHAVVARTKPMLMMAIGSEAFFIIDDPIFNGLAVSLIFGFSSRLR